MTTAKSALKPIGSPQEADLAAARRVLGLASEALSVMSHGLDETFSKAADTILAAKGRVIVSGMGKSGHVGRKVAATLSSTGTPAQFVHPAEAAHGDMGAITADDALLLLSKGGETEELAHLLTYAKRFHIPIIAIACNGESTLMRAAHVALLLPEDTEVQFALGRGRDVQAAVAEHRSLALEPALGALSIKLRPIGIIARPDVSHGAIGELEAKLQSLFNLDE